MTTVSPLRPLAALALALALPCCLASPTAIVLGPRAQPLNYTLRTGVDRGPGCSAGASVAAQLHYAGTTLLRTHDAGVLDWCVLFPNASANPLEPSSYAWAAGDAYFASIVDAGLEPYLRLGVSWSSPSPACITPPPALFATVAVQTLRHYNDGWGANWQETPNAQAARTPHRQARKPVTYCEIWNEPDGQRFWNSSAQDFYFLYDATARALKAYDAGLRVGGPGVAQPLAPSSRAYSFGLLDHVAAAGSPMDFFSWHSYGDISSPPGAWGHSPTAIYNATIAAVRGALGARGLGAVAQHVTEWAPAILGAAPVTGGAEAAAFTAAALSLMAAAGDVAVSVFYPACEGTGADGSWGMFLDYGNGTVAWRRQGRAWAAVGALLRDAPLALALAAPPAPPLPLDATVLAGASSDGARVSVVVASRLPLGSGSAGEQALSVSAPLASGGGSGAQARVSVLLLSITTPEEGAWSNATVSVVGGRASVNVPDFQPPAVAWVTFEAV